MTAKKRAANRRNGERSRGPASAGGRERSRRARWQHGYYSQHGSAWAIVGEDPSEREELRQRLRGDWSAAVHEELTEELVQALMHSRLRNRERAGQKLALARKADRLREDHRHARLLHLKMASQILAEMAEALSHRHYITTRKHLKQMEDFHKEATAKEMSDLALNLLQVLRDQIGEARAEQREQDEQALAAVQRIRGVFGLEPDPELEPKPVGVPSLPAPGVGSAVPAGPIVPQAALTCVAPPASQAGESVEPREPSASDAEYEEAVDDEEALDPQYPAFTPAEWDARQPVRQLLHNLLRRQARECESERRELLKESVKGPSALERAAQVAQAAPDSLGVRKRDEFEFHQLATLVNILVKVDRHKPLEAA